MTCSKMAAGLAGTLRERRVYPSKATSDNLAMLYPIILCGGSGTRLWPLSRKAFPKQFIPLVDGKSLLALTLERALALSGDPAHVLCVGAEEHRFLVADVAAGCGVQVRQILEPAARNTAAAIGLAALAVPGDALLIVCPADHFIPDTPAFAATIARAEASAHAGAIVTFGVVPTAPATGYGYIKRGAPRPDGGHDAARFVEKPDRERALAMLVGGGFLWNTGIFLVRADVLLAGLEAHAPDILVACQQAMAGATEDGFFTRPAPAAFAGCRAESIDYAVMEKSDNIVVFSFSGAWSDVGSWNAVADMAPGDAAGNSVSGNLHKAHHLFARGTYIYAGGDRPVVALGTENLLIVDTPDALLVADRAQAEQVKQVVATLEALDASEALHHRRVARPWGWYDSVDVGERHVVKRITVKPGASLSLQLHHRRAEHWVVVAGIAQVINGDDVIILRENESTYIPIGRKHRLANPGPAALELIEVQSGDYLSEDDIVRFDDAYGRAGQEEQSRIE